MDRILYKEANGDITCRSRDFDKVFPTLYAYEETGLTPEQIVAMKGLHTARQDLIAENEKLKAERDSMVAFMKKIGACTLCKHRECDAETQEPCYTCMEGQNYPNWEWRYDRECSH